MNELNFGKEKVFWTLCVAMLILYFVLRQGVIELCRIV